MRSLIWKEGRKVFVSRLAVRLFNATWPCSELRAERSYWFEFAKNGDLVDCDVPEQDDGSAAQALSQDCKALLFEGTIPTWARV